MPANGADRVYRELFRRQLGLDGAPIVPLADVVHWAMVARALGFADLPLARQPTYVAAGYFYAVHTPAPSEDEVDAALAFAAEHAACTLFPAVRRSDDTAALEAAGFRALSWFFEAEYRVRDGVDEDLRAQLGAKRHRELLRLERRCEEDFETSVLVGDELVEQPAALAELARLHWLNLGKYGHGRSQYEADALTRMLASPLGPRMLVLLRRPRAGGPPVQALFGLLEPELDAVVVPVHGIDHERVPAGHNLYRTGCSQLYRWGVARGLDRFDLGRGAELTKLDLGANSFHMLDNHLAVPEGAAAGGATAGGAAPRDAAGEGATAGGAALEGLDELAQACAARAVAGARALEDAAQRRDAVELIDLPALEQPVPAL